MKRMLKRIWESRDWQFWAVVVAITLSVGFLAVQLLVWIGEQ